MLTTRLKQVTAPLHKQAEQLNFSREIFSGELSRQQYIALLERNYWLNYHVEQAVERCGLSERFPLLQLAGRRKSPLLVEDLRFSHAWPPPAPCVPFPELGEDQLCGALYVVEGSTLGGKIIAQSLRKQAGFAQSVSTRFLSAYGDQTGVYWQSFIKALNQLEEDASLSAEAVIAGASSTFEYFIALSREVTHSTR